MRSTVAFALLVCVTSLVFAAGCGGDDAAVDTPTASEWADDFCTSVTDWTEELQKIGDGVGDPSSLSADTLQQAARDANAASDELIDDVRALGAPDLESGDDVKASVEAFADSVEVERDKIEAAVEDAAEITGISGAVAAIGTSLSAMATAFQTTFETLESRDVSGELESALEESSACDEIAS
ncbi:MAG: hypothetical protein WD015_01450 [Gaiellaceae bacterium]